MTAAAPSRPDLGFTPVAWAPGAPLRVLDQTRLPTAEVMVALASLDAAAEAIRALRVRGAPLIGIVAAIALADEVRRVEAGGGDAGAAVERAARVLGGTRPTAVNLRWALDRMRARASTLAPGALVDGLATEAAAILAEDAAMCRRIGEAGLSLVPDGATILTHCNAGILATGGIGTALAPVYLAHAAGRRVAVVADETRPLLQGSRLTAWELARAGIPVTVIADGMAASRLARGDVAAVLVGADRIAANGDVANKVGTYGVALAARAAGVPFYVCAPGSTIDLAAADGTAIPIEERSPDEVTTPAGHRWAADGVGVWNPAFDVTPAPLITAYVTDLGLIPTADWQAFTSTLPPAGPSARAPTP